MHCKKRLEMLFTPASLVLMNRMEKTTRDKPAAATFLISRLQRDCNFQLPAIALHRQFQCIAYDMVV